MKYLAAMVHFPAWFRRTVLRRVTVTGAGAHGVYVGDLIEISRSMRGVYDGDHVVTRIVSPVAFEARRCRPWLSGTAAYIGAMALSFLSGMFQLTVAAELAADAGESVLTWLGVAVLGLILFFQAVTMVLVSVQAERAEQLLEERGHLNSVTISAGKAIINGKLYDIPAQTVTPEEFEAIR